MSDLSDEFDFNKKKRKMTKEQALYGIWAESDESSNDDTTLSTSDGKMSTINNPINFEISSEIKKNELINMNILQQQKSLHIEKKKNNINFIRNEKKQRDFAEWNQHTSGFGMKMLLKMGYKMGKGLGKDESGIVEPIQATVRQGRVGLGAAGTESINNNQQNSISYDGDKIEDKKKLPIWKKSATKIKKKQSYSTLQNLYLESETMIATQDIDFSNKQTNRISQVKVIDMRGKETETHNDYDSFAKIESEKKKRLFRHFDIPELTLNLKQILLLSEKKIKNLIRKKRSNQDLLINYNYELDLLKKQLDSIFSDNSKIRSIIDMISGCFTTPLSNNNEIISSFGQYPVSMDPVESLTYNMSVLEKLVNFPEYFEYRLSTLCVPLFLGWIKLLLNHNSIIDLGVDVVNFFKKWCEFSQKEAEQKILFNHSSSISDTSLTSFVIYEKVLWYYILPSLRHHINIYTEPDFFCKNIINFLNFWYDLFPKWFKEHIFYQLIYPKLKNFIEECDLKNESYPIHHWIHPWLPFFIDKIEMSEQIFYIVQVKLCTLLKNWHPSDRSIKNIITPWLDKLSDKSVNNLLKNLILPKLELLIANELEINPSNQNITPIEHFFDWYSIIPDQYMVEILNNHFFQKWHTILHYWLKQDDCNLEEIAIWYKGWKSLIPKSILEFHSIQKNFTLALHMINYTSQGTDIGSNIEQFISKYEEIQRESNPIQTASIKQTAIKVSNYSTNNFKEIVENYASQRGILFKPISNTIGYSDGKTYYQFGNSIIYIDRGVIFVKHSQPTITSCYKMSDSSNAIWQPISLQDLINSVSQQ